MAVVKLNTRIQLKYDTYSNWTANKTVVPLVGELCVVVIPAEAGAVVQEPAILFKVGDGVKTFEQLGWVSGISADVYDWAKAATKPSYSASEITGLDTYISTNIQDTDTQYKIEKVSGSALSFKLFSKTKSGSWNAGTQITLDAPAITLITGTSNGTVKFNGTDVPVKGLGSAAYTSSTVYDAAGAAIAVLGTTSNTKDEYTVYGVRKRVDDVNSGLTTVKGQVGTSVDAASATGSLYARVAKNATDIATKATKSTTLSGYGITDTYTKTEVNTELNKKANSSSLKAIATTGNVNDLVQTSGDYMIFNCGSASTLV